MKKTLKNRIIEALDYYNKNELHPMRRLIEDLSLGAYSFLGTRIVFDYNDLIILFGKYGLTPHQVEEMLIEVDEVGGKEESFLTGRRQ